MIDNAKNNRSNTKLFAPSFALVKLYPDSFTNIPNFPVSFSKFLLVHCFQQRIENKNKNKNFVTKF